MNTGATGVLRVTLAAGVLALALGSTACGVGFDARGHFTEGDGVYVCASQHMPGARVYRFESWAPGIIVTIGSGAGIEFTDRDTLERVKLTEGELGYKCKLERAITPEDRRAQNGGR